MHHGDLGLDEHMMGMDHDVHVAAQKREIRQMREWRRSWYGDDGGRSMPGHRGSSGHMRDE